MENQYFEKIDEKLFDSIFKKFDENRKDKDIVYHYTTLETFNKIIDKNGNSSLLFSKASDLADKTEIKFGLDVLRNLMGNTGKNEYESLIELINDNNNLNHYFIFCTGEKRDSYRQWVKFSDGGRGICIGFNRKKLFDKLNDEKSNILAYIFPLLYYNEDFTLYNKRIKHFEEDSLAYFYTLNKTLGSDEFANDKEYRNEIFEAMHVFASLIKKSQYRGEKEWRYLVLAKPDNNNKYYCLEDIVDCIESITIGPDIQGNNVSDLESTLEPIKPYKNNIDILWSRKGNLFSKESNHP